MFGVTWSPGNTDNLQDWNNVFLLIFVLMTARIKKSIQLLENDFKFFIDSWESLYLRNSWQSHNIILIVLQIPWDYNLPFCPLWHWLAKICPHSVGRYIQLSEFYPENVLVDPQWVSHSASFGSLELLSIFCCFRHVKKKNEPERILQSWCPCFHLRFPFLLQF